MPYTEHDNYDHKHNSYTPLDKHAHYLNDSDDDIDHGDLIEHTYQYRGDWYAVHTH